jgi:hypothetical protein
LVPEHYILELQSSASFHHGTDGGGQNANGDERRSGHTTEDLQLPSSQTVRDLRETPGARGVFWQLGASEFRGIFGKRDFNIRMCLRCGIAGDVSLIYCWQAAGFSETGIYLARSGRAAVSCIL